MECGLDRGESCRAIARGLGRAPSTVANEVARHRFVTSPRARYGEAAPDDLSGACERLQSWPRCCNGCKRRAGYGCGRRPKVFYSARMAQAAARGAPHDTVGETALARSVKAGRRDRGPALA